MPISTVKAQNSAFIVPVCIRLAPKLIPNTIASGDRATTQRSGEKYIACAVPVVNISSATMPLRSTPLAM